MLDLIKSFREFNCHTCINSYTAQGYYYFRYSLFNYDSLIILMLILIESRSMLIVYWLVDLIICIFNKNSIKNKIFSKIEIMFCKISFNMLIFICLYINQHPDIQIP